MSYRLLGLRCLLWLLFAVALPAAATPDWWWNLYGSNSNTTLNLKDSSGSAFTAQVNPTSANARLTQDTVSQPPIIVVQSTGGGLNWAMWWGGVGTGTSSNWTVPSGVTNVLVTLVAGGGGGGGGNSSAGSCWAGGGGGGSGYVLLNYPCTVTSGAVIAVTVGAGGAAGIGTAVNGATGSAGGAGGTSSFGACVSVSGGGGGSGGKYSAALAGNGGAGGAGGGGGGLGGAIGSAYGLGGAGTVGGAGGSGGYSAGSFPNAAASGFPGMLGAAGGRGWGFADVTFTSPGSPWQMNTSPAGAQTAGGTGGGGGGGGGGYGGQGGDGGLGGVGWGGGGSGGGTSTIQSGGGGGGGYVPASDLVMAWTQRGNPSSGCNGCAGLGGAVLVRW